MYARLGFLGLIIASKPSALTDSILVVKDSSSDYQMLNESYLTADGSDTSQETTQPHRSGSIGLYRHWLSLIFGAGGASPANSQFPLRTIQDGWLVIDQIKREDPVFQDIWNPEVSGDWSEYVPRPLERGFSHTSPLLIGPSVWTDQVDVSGRGPLLRWAYDTDNVEPGQRDFDRMNIWLKSADVLRNASFPSYLESVVIEIPDNVVDAISRDVPRTIPAELHPRMTRVLQAYAARNPDVGFCQGMSYIVSTLLQNEWISDEDAFNILSALVEGVNVNYYDNALAGLHSDLRRLEKFMFYKSDQKLSVPIELVLVEPMICIFTRLVPVDSALRIMDIALTHGKVGLFSVYLALIELLNPELEKAIQGAESPSIAIVDGAVAFKLALVGLLTEDCDSLIRRAEGFLLTFRSDLEQLVKEDVSIEREDPQVEVVMPSTTSAAPNNRLLNRLRIALASVFMSSDGDDWDERGWIAGWPYA
jgi:hypothetical protein